MDEEINLRLPSDRLVSQGRLVPGSGYMTGLGKRVSSCVSMDASD